MADNLELAARIRAARNYARIKQKDMAKKLSVSIETYGRIEAGTRPASDEELAIISEACTPEVPPWFIRQGWLGGITNPETMAGIFRRQGDENRVPSTMEARNAEGESLGIVDLKLLAAEERIYEEIARQVEASRRALLREVRGVSDRTDDRADQTPSEGESAPGDQPEEGEGP